MHYVRGEDEVVYDQNDENMRHFKEEDKESSGSSSSENTLLLVYGRKSSKRLYSKSTLHSHLKTLMGIAEEKMQSKDFVGAHPNVYYKCAGQSTTSFSTYLVVLPGMCRPSILSL